MSGNGRASDGRSVAAKLFAILDAFDTTGADSPADGSRALSLSEIAREAQLPVSTAHRLLGEWVRWGGIVRNDDNTYQLSTQLWRFGSSAPSVRRLSAVARPYLEDLFDVTRQHVNLAVLDGDHALYLEHVTGHDSVSIISGVGSRLPLHATGVGLVLLAFGPPELLERVIALKPERFLPNTVTTDAEIRSRVAEIRATELSLSVNELTEDSFSAAAPIRDRTNAVVASVSVVAHAAQATDPQFAIAVRVAARGISRALGWLPRR
jgi:DNA-binding IclR family transcriptional regulator